ncbi:MULTISPECIES: prepilin-type N-terminal cleavage/methylation domain-containing protein [unclassified Psychrobacter]|uniref:prepilin-type N-terminal cleavage/methylation domain-containing protein n=1 Tax=unclassified Psychrobacter TaxID=196806 RepID=UPI000354B05E|nr:MULTISPECIES: prepilin-type N-terminal cleavage/methylation domain-containing protein [unclassified Psychrobacter]AGP47889.1 pilus assembly protein PilW [Psychrobacter sp. G]KAA0938913.1 prepilin-type N-terminal cleavage/methylation domain-containing protein [Psychrobacter sp. ANT_H59]
MSYSHKNNYINDYQAGFTLIELMISLVLGLIVSAAAIQVYLINVKTSSIQASGSELQDASVFGLQQLEKSIRLANLGNPTTRIDGTTPSGGIVLTGLNIGVPNPNEPNPYPNTGYLTRRAGDSAVGANGWTGISNTNTNSDQLTIQYINITGAPMTDCEGAVAAVNDIVIERYFVRQATGDTSTGAIKKLVLACDAGRVKKTGGIDTVTPSSDSRNFGQAGQEFIVNIDQFKVLLGAQYTTGTNAGQIIYLPSSAYSLITTGNPVLTAVKIGLIVHGSTPIIGSAEQSEFALLGQSSTENKLKADTSSKKKVRSTYETTTLLRNARVVNINTSL